MEPNPLIVDDESAPFTAQDLLDARAKLFTGTMRPVLIGGGEPPFPGLAALMTAVTLARKPLMQAPDTCGHGRPTGTLCPQCMGTQEIPLTMSPSIPDPAEMLQEGNRRRRRRWLNSPSRVEGYKDPIQNNNEQANRNAARNRAKAKKKATEKMKRKARK
jgi:hypothetical protein